MNTTRILGILLTICLLANLAMIPNQAAVSFAEPEIESPKTGLKTEQGEKPETELETKTGIISESSESEFQLLSGDAQSTLGEGTLGGGKKRYSILVLDRSGSMKGEPLEKTKIAATKFCKKVLESPGENYVAVVIFNHRSVIYVQFTKDYALLEEKINNLYAESITNLHAGLENVEVLLNQITDPDAIKNVVLLSDGMASTGEMSEDGPYVRDDHPKYKLANAVYKKAKALHPRCLMYSLGFFQSSDPSDLAFGTRVMTDIQNAGFYSVNDPNDLDFTFGEIADDIIKKKSTFRYAGVGRDHRATCYYDDEYFTRDTYTYNPHLATMSLSLALASFGSEATDDYAAKAKNAVALLGDMQYANIEHNYGESAKDGIAGKPSRDSIGVVIGSRKVSMKGVDTTILAVAIRGGGNGSEWGGDLKIGENSAHQGFVEAKATVLAFLKDYVQTKGIKGNIKLWITGYGRGGAVANLLAPTFVDKTETLDSCTMEPADIYTYTFDAPAPYQGIDAKQNVIYNNIFNVLDTENLAAKWSPSEWGFVRFGRDMKLPERITLPRAEYQKAYDRMKAVYAKLDGAVALDESAFQNVAWTGSGLVQTKTEKFTYLQRLLNTLAKDYYEDRAGYTKSYQDAVVHIREVMANGSMAQREFARTAFYAKLRENAVKLIKLVENPFWDGEKEAKRLVAGYFDEALQQAEIQKNQTPEFAKAMDVVGELIVDMLEKHTDLVLTGLVNEARIRQAENPMRLIAWMQSMDTHYEPGGDVKFTSGKSRIVRINCPVDVRVWNANDDLVASIENDVPSDISLVAVGINADGEKYVVLPASEEYKLECKATGDGEMTYSVGEFNPELGDMNKLYVFPAVAIQKGDVLSSALPALTASELEDGQGGVSGTVYTLERGGKSFAPVVKTGAEVANIMFSVDVSVNDETLGMATGGGVRKQGAFAKVTATPADGAKFLGWFKNDVSVSTDLVYRFAVTENVDLVAKFEVDPSRDVTTVVNAGTGGKVEGAGTQKAGMEVRLKAVPNADHSFDGWFEQDVKIADNPELTFLAVANRTLEARFKKKSGGGGGSGGDTGGGTGGDTGGGNTGGSSGGSGSGGSGSSGTGSESTTTPTITIPSTTTTTSTTEDAALVDIVVDGTIKKAKKDKDGGLHLDEAFFEGAKKPLLIKFPHKNPSVYAVMMRKDADRQMIVPFSYHDDNTMYMLVSKPGVYYVAENKKTFTDVEKHWAEKTIAFIAARGVFEGDGARFHPNDAMTRGMFVQVLMNLEGADKTGITSKSFADVEQGKWYYAAVEWAFHAGIVNGFGDGTFGPDLRITREQMAVMLQNYLKYKGLTLEAKENVEPFADAAEVSPWAKDAVESLKAMGLVEGYQNRFNPKDTATRASIAQLFRNFIEACFD